MYKNPMTDVGNLFTTIEKMQLNDQDVLKLLYVSLQKNFFQSLQLTDQILNVQRPSGNRQ